MMPIHVLSTTLSHWLQQVLPTGYEHCLPLAGDLSVRRYFRLQYQATTYILMDASAQKSTCYHFVEVARIWRDLGLCVPIIYAADLTQGFLLLSDFGANHYLDALHVQSATQLYRQACDILHTLQSYSVDSMRTGIDSYAWPSFDAALYQRELDGFTTWFLPYFTSHQPSTVAHANLPQIFDLIIHEAMTQPQVCTHRDYHARNLMVLPQGITGILDFQDARWGPICYDLASLLRDCYIAWPPTQVVEWVQTFYARAVDLQHLPPVGVQQFWRWFDWIGLQRHLKCLGLFARWVIQEQQPQYAVHLPRILTYARDVCRRYPEFAGLQRLLE